MVEQTARYPVLSGRDLVSLVHESVWAWVGDRASRKGAALAFYTVFSLAPILVISIAIAGFFFGEAAARGEILEQARGLIGTEGAAAVQALVQNAARPEAGIVATVGGLVALFVGATTALAELKDGLDQIWNAPADRTKGFWYFVRKRLLSIGVILALGFLLLVSLVLSAVFAALSRRWGGESVAGELLQLVNFLFSFGLVTALFATIYKVLPAVRIAWRDVIIGALVTALLFNLGKTLIGIYLGNSAVASTYGAAGSVVILLIWVYYSAQIFLLGAEFTKVYTYRFGSRCPAARAIRTEPAHSS